MGSPPKVVWVRFGNMRIRQLTDTLASLWSSVINYLREFDLVVLYDDRIECFKVSETR